MILTSDGCIPINSLLES